jgi:hypothetical protein
VTICEFSEAIIQTIALVLLFASALLLFWALGLGWQQQYIEQMGGSGTVTPKPSARRVGYAFLILGTIAGAAGIWGKLWLPWCG